MIGYGARLVLSTRPQLVMATREGQLMLGRGLDDRLRCEAGVKYEAAAGYGHQSGLTVAG
jgi:hypothetical protein